MSLKGERREEGRFLRAEVVGGLPGRGGLSTKLWGNTLAWSLGFHFSFIKFRCFFFSPFSFPALPSPSCSGCPGLVKSEGIKWHKISSQSSLQSFLKEARQWDLPKMRGCAPVAEIWLSGGSPAPVGSGSEPSLGTGEMGRDP